MTKPRARANGEGSIYKYRNGYAAYAWVDLPDGNRDRKFVYGRTRDIVHDKWIKLQGESKQGATPTSTPTLAKHIKYWLTEFVQPELAPLSYVTYESLTRRYVVPYLGKKKLNKLTARDVRKWVNLLRKTCQCCAQGKDAARPAWHKDPRRRRRCCAIGECCEQFPSQRTIQAARDALRAALSFAMTEELISKNVAAVVKVSKPRRRKFRPWTPEQARTLLEAARQDDDPLYAAWVLILVLGLRRGEVLGLTWEDIDFENGVLTPNMQIQRAGRQLLHRETKTETSAVPLPMPDICMAALRIRRTQQVEARRKAGELWQESQLVFTTRYGTPIEPGNLTRMFPARCVRAGVQPIRLHDTRHTCGSLLVALGVHPRVIMEILRHTQIAITMEIYAHVPTEQTRAALKRLGESLG